MNLLIRRLRTERLKLVVHPTTLSRVLRSRLEGHRARQVLGNLHKDKHNAKLQVYVCVMFCK